MLGEVSSTLERLGRRKGSYSVTPSPASSPSSSLPSRRRRHDSPFGLPIRPTRNMAGARYWGEERCGDAIYAVYLRKVRYVAPGGGGSGASSAHFRTLESEDSGTGSGESSEHLQWETLRERVIKSGTLPRLVDSLFTADGTYDARQFNVFFATYRAFAEAWDVLRLLLATYDAAVTGQRGASGKSQEWRSAIQDSVRAIIGFWLELWPEDFQEPPRYPCLTELLELAKLHSPHLKELIPKAAKAKSTLPSQRQNGLNGLGKILATGAGPGGGLESMDFILSPGRVKSPDMSRMDPGLVAEQLTYWDAELFRRLVPWQCQAQFWGRRKRGRKEAQRVASVSATVDLFNALLSRLQTSILNPPTLTAQRRALIISKWIQVAVELRVLKNFSSLRAVLSGLQSEPIHRLKASWALVPDEDQAEFEELARIFGGSTDEEDSENARRVLEAEGTGKNVDSYLAGTGNRLHRRAKSDMGNGDEGRNHHHRRASGGCGTVPYLGTFLTDLTFLQEAFPDTVPSDEGVALINFDKRRKEFEILAQLKLFQTASKQYDLQPDPTFADWFGSLPSLPEKDCYLRSLQIEPQIPNGSSTPDPPRKNKEKGSSLSRLITGMWSDSSGTGTGSEAEESWLSIVPSTVPMPAIPRSQTVPIVPFAQLPKSGSTGSTQRQQQHPPGLDYQRSEFCPAEVFPEAVARCHSRTSNSSTSSGLATPLIALNGRPTSPPKHKPSMVKECSRESSGSSGDAEETGLILGIELHASLQPTQSPSATVLFKCMRLVNGERLNDLIAKALEKHLLDDLDPKDYCLVQLKPTGAKALEKHLLDDLDPKDYCLVQLKPTGGEFILPDGCNPFYALVRGKEGERLHLQLRRKGAVSSLKGGANSGRVLSTSSSTLGFAKARRKAGTLFRWNSGFL